MKLTTTAQVSVDGVMQGPGGPEEDERGRFERGGWAHFDDEASTVMDDIYQRAEAFLFGAHISPLISASSHVVADPVRTRKLLLNASELSGLVGSVERKGYTLVPLELYWKNGRAKLAIGLAKGKKQHDKRAVDKDRDLQRDKARIMRGR